MASTPLPAGGASCFRAPSFRRGEPMSGSLAPRCTVPGAPPSPGLDRRGFLRHAGRCAATLAAASLFAPDALRAAFARRARGEVIAEAPWGRVEEVAEGVWALVSTPLEGDFTTIANGGLIVGRDAILAVEGLGTTRGARWLSDLALEHLGRRPTHVLLTHHHGDHTLGQAGYVDRPGTLRVLTSEATLRRLESSDQERLMPTEVLSEPEGETELDLGGRVVRVVPRAGHTVSDLVVEVDDPRIVFAGDLVWNGLFPNFVDARPLQLMEAVRATLAEERALFVPGHGDLATRGELEAYLEVLERLEVLARRSFARGETPSEAAEAFRIPPSLGTWTFFRDDYVRRALDAWHRALSAGEGA
ncbi:MAG: MBL fold metallo-hydrolase [Gemmatimonadetes bacterium]|nr:MAG: MBL fold metallo-hydrolase [Gemmatimonadota bacterium]